MSDDLDGFLTTNQVARLRACSPRALYNHVKRGDWPPPDVPGELGASNLWRASTVRRALDDLQARQATKRAAA